MFTGTMIDDLIRTVEKTERQARTEAVVRVTAPVIEVYSAPSTLVYQWAMEHTVAGVA
jgi:hypothetical protein